MRVAYFSPMPPEASGIADYSALLVPALREHVDLTVVKRGTKRPPRGSDLAVYHIGNNPDAHGWILDALRRVPGLVVLHDFVLHHLVAGVTIGRRDGHGYLDAMERESRRRRTAPRPRRARQAAAAALGGAPRGVPPDRRSALSRDRSRRPFPVRRGSRARRGLRGPDLPGRPSGVARSGSRAGRDRRRPGDRVVRQRQPVEADPAAARGIRPPSLGARRAPGSSSSAPSRRGSTSSAGSSVSGSPATGSCVRATSTSVACGS